MEIDETSLNILKRLEDGRVSFQKIAESLSLSEGTVRSRVNSMIESGIVDISGSVDLEALPGYNMIQVGVKLSTMDLVGKGEEISKLPSVMNVLVVTGRFDLMATVLLNNNNKLADFYLNEMNRVDGISGVETFVVYKEFNTKIPCSAIRTN